MILPDRLARVTGERIYARDYQPDRMEGWTGTPAHAYLLRATSVDRVFEGLSPELGSLPGRVGAPVTAKALADRGVPNPGRDRDDSPFGWLLVPEGRCAEMFGQPVAILLFEHARAIADFVESDLFSRAIRYGVKVEPAPNAEYKESWLVRYSPSGRAADEPEFSWLKDHDEAHARQYAEKIKQDAAREKGWRSLERTFSTPSADPMFMEPEAGIAWWDRDGGNALRMVVGTQSPGKDVHNVTSLWKDGWKDGSPPPPARVDYTAAPPGGAFGGRDESSFPLYLAAAALFAPGPVRLALSRSDQFLSGIKRHASTVSNHLFASPDGTLQALQSEVTLDGGGERNLSGAVLSLAMLHATGPYRIPRSSVHGAAKISTSAPAGSMRGFGIPQVTFAIESMIDELAAELGRDPIEYRLDQLLRKDDRDASGMQVTHPPANVAVCHAARQHPLWVKRQEDKQHRDRHGVLYGVGFACCMQAYGTTVDAGLAGVELARDGSVSLCSNAVDMGQGTTEALAAATAPVLGAEASRVTLGDLGAFHESLRKLPASSMSASMTVFFHLHAVEQACRVVYQQGILPAAGALWGTVPGDARWEAGRLVADGFRPLPLRDLAARAHDDGRVAGAQIHATFHGQFGTATFPDLGQRPIDALAVARAPGPYQPVPPLSAQPLKTIYKRTLYASVGHLLAVEVYRDTGRVQVVDAVTVLDPGEVHHRALMDGQVHGGLAMGLGMALSEQLPSGPDFMDPNRNLNKYLVPRVTTVPPLDRLRVLTVPPEAENATPRRKGIAEAAMTTVAPALANAVAHATGGLRLRQLPFTPQRVREALQISPLPAPPAPARPPLRSQGAPDRPPPAPFELQVNGETLTGVARPDDLLIDVLHQAGKTGTKYACGIGHCGACKVAVQESPQGPLIPVLSCYARLSSVQGLRVTTVEGLGSKDRLHPLQEAFLESHAFQCGYSTPGMLMTGAILIDQLGRPGGSVPERLLDREITAAMANQVCRCTGYVRYFDAIKKVILGWPTRLARDAPPRTREPEPPPSIWFRVMKRSRNDERLKLLEGRFDAPEARLHFHRPMAWDDCTGEVTVPAGNLRTREPARDLNLRRFLFRPAGSTELRFTLHRAEPLEAHVPGEALPLGFTVPLRVHGTIRVGSVPVKDVTAEVALTVMSETRMLARSRSPFRLELSRLGLPLDAFMREFGLLEMDPEIELGIDNVSVTYKTT